MQENHPDDLMDLVVILTHEVSTLLEAFVTPEEARAVWPEALEVVARSIALMTDAGLSPPAPALNVLKWGRA